mgnify:FL=1
MKAMILAAGLGSRLRPLTDTLPKALIPVGDYTLLQFAMLKLKHAGCHEIIINIHHKSDLIRQYLAKNNNFGCKIEFSDESEKLLDTGGGLKKAAWFFDDHQPFILYNCDIISSIDLAEMYDYHLKTNVLTTLAVRQRPTQRYLLFDPEMRLCGWKNVKTEETILLFSAGSYSELAFSGIHIISPELLKHFPPEDKFSIMQTYLSLARHHNITGFRDNTDYWLDAGKPEALAQAHEIIQKIKF